MGITTHTGGRSIVEINQKKRLSPFFLNFAITRAYDAGTPKIIAIRVELPVMIIEFNKK
jgi:hypothetical protein